MSGRTARWIVIGTLVAIVFGPILYRALPKEVARWHVAAAQDHWLKGDNEASQQSLTKALSWDPHCVEAFLLRSQIFRESDDLPNALAALDEAAKLWPDDRRIRQQRHLLLMASQRYQEVIDEQSKELALAERASVTERGSLLNDIAYARALGNIDAEKGLQEINSALEQDPKNAAFLDTRAMLLYQLGRYEEARADLDRSVTDVEAQLAEIDASFAKRAQDPNKTPAIKLMLADIQRNVAVIRYHRALVWEKLGEQDKADADKQRVRELGHEPSPKLF